MELSLIVIGYRTTHWPTLYESVKHGIKNYTYEIIFVGPSPLPIEMYYKKNVRYLKDDGPPTRKFSLATRIAEGKYIGFLADDAIVFPNTLDTALATLIEKDSNGMMAIRHIQSHNYNNRVENFSQKDPSWWFAKTHPILNQKHVNPEWGIVCDPLMQLKTYNDFGGIDCSYNFLNFAIHDLTFRIQQSGLKTYISPDIVMSTPIHPHEHHSSIEAIVNADTNNYISMWSSPRPSIIKPDSWKNQKSPWNKYESQFTYSS